jgi:phage shock protein A
MEEKRILLKQHKRDMEAILQKREMQVGRLLTTRSRLEQDHRRYQQQCDKLEQDIDAALLKDRDDIARLLIKKLRPLLEYTQELKGRIQVLQEDIETRRKELDRQKLQYQQLKHQSLRYFQQSSRQKYNPDTRSAAAVDMAIDISEEEIELELLQRKDRLNRGEVPS